MMKAQINLITIWTNDIDKMKNFIIKFSDLKLKMILEVMLNLKTMEQDLLFV